MGAVGTVAVGAVASLDREAGLAEASVVVGWAVGSEG